MVLKLRNILGHADQTGAFNCTEDGGSNYGSKISWPCLLDWSISIVSRITPSSYSDAQCTAIGSTPFVRFCRPTCACARDELQVVCWR